MMRSETNVAIPPGVSIKEQLERHNMTQKEFAIRMGYSEKHISHLLNGKNELSYETVLKLEKVLGIPAKVWKRKEARYREQLERVKDDLQNVN